MANAAQTIHVCDYMSNAEQMLHGWRQAAKRPGGELCRKMREKPMNGGTGQGKGMCAQKAANVFFKRQEKGKDEGQTLVRVQHKKVGLGKQHLASGIAGIGTV